MTAEQVGAYSKTDSTDLFINKTEAENGLFVAKTVVNSQDWDKILDAGIYTVLELLEQTDLIRVQLMVL